MFSQKCIRFEFQDFTKQDISTISAAAAKEIYVRDVNKLIGAHPFNPTAIETQKFAKEKKNTTLSINMLQSSTHQTPQGPSDQKQTFEQNDEHQKMPSNKKKDSSVDKNKISYFEPKDETIGLGLKRKSSTKPHDAESNIKIQKIEEEVKDDSNVQMQNEQIEKEILELKRKQMLNLKINESNSTETNTQVNKVDGNTKLPFERPVYQLGDPMPIVPPKPPKGETETKAEQQHRRLQGYYLKYWNQDMGFAPGKAPRNANQTIEQEQFDDGNKEKANKGDGTVTVEDLKSKLKFDPNKK